MRRYILPAIVILIAAGIQGNMPGWLNIFGAKPDLVLIVLISYSLSADPDFGAILGFIAGLVQESTVGGGSSFIVTRTITGFLAGLINARLFGENPIVPVVSAAGLTFVCEAMFLFANPRPNLFIVGKTVLGECVINAIFTFVVYLIISQFETNRKIKLANARL